MTLKIDVLPAPLRPMMPHRSPSATVKVMFLKSLSAPNEMPTLETESRVTEREQKTNKRQRREARRALSKRRGAEKAKRRDRSTISPSRGHRRPVARSPTRRDAGRPARIRVAPGGAL